MEEASTFASARFCFCGVGFFDADFGGAELGGGFVALEGAALGTAAFAFGGLPLPRAACLPFFFSVVLGVSGAGSYAF